MNQLIRKTKNLPVLICSLLAGGLGYLFYSAFELLNLAPVFAIGIPVLMAVPLGMLGAYAAEKGTGNLGRADVINSLAGGFGAAVGVDLIVLFS